MPKTKRPLAPSSSTDPVPSRAPSRRVAASTIVRGRRARGPYAPSRPALKTTWLALVVGALALVIGALLIHRWIGSRGVGGQARAGPALPDAPTPQEQTLLAAVASARSGDPTPVRRLGDYYTGADRPFAALWAYAVALQAQPADVPATFGLARALEAARFHDAGISRLRQLLAREPGQPQAAAQLAELYLRTGQPEAALAVVRTAGAAFASSKDGAVLEGRVRQALGDATGAKAAYWHAVAQDANDADVRHRIGLVALSRGEIFAAQQAFGSARIFAPSNPRYNVDLGRAFAASSQLEERRRAPEFYAAALNQNLRFGPAHYEAGVWYLRESRWPEAIERLRMAVEVDPSDAGAHEQLARALERVGRRAEACRQRGLADDARDLRVAALREYQAWAALDPGNPEAELQVAQSSFDINRTKEAQARLTKACQRFPRDAALRERLIAFDILGLDQAQARRLCQEWLREEPGSPQALWLLGRSVEAEQQYAEAVRIDEQALAKEPGNPQWLGAFGETLLKLPGSAVLPRAVAVLSRAATGDPDEPRWRLTLAQGLQRLGLIEEARRQALRALDLDPKQSRAYTLVLQCARQQGAAGPLALYADLLRTVEAQQHEETALRQATWERPRDPETYAALAAFLIRTGNLAAAESQLTEALRLRPDWPPVRARLALVRRLREVL
jgi:tetratricopeptide (TPR) repeat protein